ncbi:pollen-specific leucine-rich repeat extensin-like protein 4 [Iris pallida]|uniref:Pollen-specific leucine-rich repeat extensin-like protein 4 n=1 Tax=Iris pallida TaxID=29817 RepID=A0AAX6FHP5_IRIPA|nr:pollen-specific leucine-rich repeat extensin-like protein 4 [Iris pallida]
MAPPPPLLASPPAGIFWIGWPVGLPGPTAPIQLFAPLGGYPSSPVWPDQAWPSPSWGFPGGQPRGFPHPLPSSQSLRRPRQRRRFRARRGPPLVPPPPPFRRRPPSSPPLLRRLLPRLRLSSGLPCARRSPPPPAAPGLQRLRRSLPWPSQRHRRRPLSRDLLLPPPPFRGRLLLSWRRLTRSSPSRGRLQLVPRPSASPARPHPPSLPLRRPLLRRRRPPSRGLWWPLSPLVRPMFLRRRWPTPRGPRWQHSVLLPPPLLRLPHGGRRRALPPLELPRRRSAVLFRRRRRLRRQPPDTSSGAPVAARRLTANVLRLRPPGSRPPFSSPPFPPLRLKAVRRSLPPRRSSARLSLPSDCASPSGPRRNWHRSLRSPRRATLWLSRGSPTPCRRPPPALVPFRPARRPVAAQSWASPVPWDACPPSGSALPRAACALGLRASLGQRNRQTALGPSAQRLAWLALFFFFLKFDFF